MLPDGLGGAVAVWSDLRGADSSAFAQRIDSSGAVQWATNGVAVSDVAGHQDQVFTIGASVNGAIITFRDQRTGNDDVRAQRIEFANGTYGLPAPRVVPVADNPSDQGGAVVINWLASDKDAPGTPQITHYSIWRATDTIPRDARGPETASDVGLQDFGLHFEGPASRVQPTIHGEYFWEWLANQPALSSSGYSYLASTRRDSISSDPALHYFQVVAHTSDMNLFWISAPDSGYSLDNLAPASPSSVSAARTSPDVVIQWSPGAGVTEPDLLHYAV